MYVCVYIYIYIYIYGWYYSIKVRVDQGVIARKCYSTFSRAPERKPLHLVSCPGHFVLRECLTPFSRDTFDYRTVRGMKQRVFFSTITFCQEFFINVTDKILIPLIDRGDFESVTRVGAQKLYDNSFSLLEMVIETGFDYFFMLRKRENRNCVEQTC